MKSKKEKQKNGKLKHREKERESRENVTRETVKWSNAGVTGTIKSRERNVAEGKCSREQYLVDFQNRCKSLIHRFKKF